MSVPNHSALEQAFSIVINSDSIVDRAIHVCLVDFQYTTPPLKVNINLLVDITLLDSKIQFAFYDIVLKICGISRNWKMNNYFETNGVIYTLVDFLTSLILINFSIATNLMLFQKKKYWSFAGFTIWHGIKLHKGSLFG